MFAQMHKPLPVLMVDDDPNTERLFRLCLSRLKLDMPFQCVSTGAKALNYLKGTEEFSNRQVFPFPKIIFIDSRLPGQSGIDLIPKIRKDLGIRIPILMFSASNWHRDVSIAYERGASSYIVKPVSLQQFEDIINTVNDYWSLVSVPEPSNGLVLPPNENAQSN
jgi:CheY-like chemotaxis protein